MENSTTLPGYVGVTLAIFLYEDGIRLTLERLHTCIRFILSFPLLLLAVAAYPAQDMDSAWRYTYPIEETHLRPSHVYSQVKECIEYSPVADIILSFAGTNATRQWSQCSRTSARQAMGVLYRARDPTNSLVPLRSPYPEISTVSERLVRPMDIKEPSPLAIPEPSSHERMRHIHSCHTWIHDRCVSKKTFSLLFPLQRILKEASPPQVGVAHVRDRAWSLMMANVERVKECIQPLAISAVVAKYKRLIRMIMALILIYTSSTPRIDTTAVTLLYLLSFLPRRYSITYCDNYQNRVRLQMLGIGIGGFLGFLFVVYPVIETFSIPIHFLYEWLYTVSFYRWAMGYFFARQFYVYLDKTYYHQYIWKYQECLSLTQRPFIEYSGYEPLLFTPYAYLYSLAVVRVFYTLVISIPIHLFLEILSSGILFLSTILVYDLNIRFFSDYNRTRRLILGLQTILWIFLSSSPLPSLLNSIFHFVVQVWPCTCILALLMGTFILHKMSHTVAYMHRMTNLLLPTTPSNATLCHPC